MRLSGKAIIDLECLKRRLPLINTCDPSHPMGVCTITAYQCTHTVTGQIRPERELIPLPRKSSPVRSDLLVYETWSK